MASVHLGDAAAATTPRWRRSDLHKVKRWIGPNLTSCSCICLCYLKTSADVVWIFLKLKVMLDSSQLLLKGKHFPEFNSLYVSSNGVLIDQGGRWETKRNFFRTRKFFNQTRFDQTVTAGHMTMTTKVINTLLDGVTRSGSWSDGELLVDMLN